MLPDELSQTTSYENMGDNSTISANIPSNNVILTAMKRDSFEFTFDPENTPVFYSYYVAGYSLA